jgi:hypothetical protein
MATPQQHKERAAKQTMNMKEYFKNIDDCLHPKNNDFNTQKVYDTMCKYTRKHIASYMQWNGGDDLPDIRFASFHDITPSCVVHRKTVQHMNAQSILYEGANAQQVSGDLTYAELLREYARKCHIPQLTKSNITDGTAVDAIEVDDLDVNDDYYN